MFAVAVCVVVPELEPPEAPALGVDGEAAGELLIGVEGCVVVVGNGEYHREDAGAWLALTVELIGLAPALDDGGEATEELWAGAEA